MRGIWLSEASTLRGWVGQGCLNKGAFWVPCQFIILQVVAQKGEASCAEVKTIRVDHYSKIGIFRNGNFIFSKWGFSLLSTFIQRCGSKGLRWILTKRLILFIKSALKQFFMHKYLFLKKIVPLLSNVKIKFWVSLKPAQNSREAPFCSLQ